jgi:DNA-binding MarR family transcriptional regulator
MKAPRKALDRVDKVLANWAKERPDLDASAKAIVGRLIRLQAVLLHTVSTTFKTFKINPGEYAVLCTLRVSGHPYQLPPKKIIQSVLLSSGGMSNLLEKMEQKQLIKRTFDPHDRRGVLVKLTPHGKTIIDAAMAAHVKAEHQLITALDKNEQKTLVSLLRKLLLALD